MNQYPEHLPQSFKGIALFTPGGDLVYCIDPEKRNRWHLHLCAVLQHLLGLSGPPHFLVPCFTATLDQWLDPRSQQMQLSAEAYPAVLRYQALLNAIFDTPHLEWQPISQRLELCDPMVIATHREQFPQLWENHDLIVRYGQPTDIANQTGERLPSLAWSPGFRTPEESGYVLRLFVSSHSAATERILVNLRQLLEQSLHRPYTLKIVDIYKHPEQAEADQITATPTLIKAWPPPVKRIVGDLDNLAKILQILVATDPSAE